ncbi:hypothetical protein DRF65_18620 [Chryseobacterium pennae]|uniref:Uncharacterized protein n=2 Tax=Chryseobacterium pennae TaxID=2258962 RepID=A0A3D9C4L8_9FLAO|nr:hypothetical protein DRF65_18620 [Chryseobacterium pennae]
MQLLTQDYKKGDKRVVSSGLYFNEHPAKESQIRTGETMTELDALEKNPEVFQKKYNRNQ